MSVWSARDVFPFTAPLSSGEETTHKIHTGGDGPPLLLLQELPGIGPETLALAARLNAAGFTVYLPHLFGAFGRTQTLRNLRRLFRARHGISLFLNGAQSPVAAWLRALAAEINRREGGRGVGVIGMGLTASFALPLMAEDAVAGGVACQPSLPLWPCRSAPHMSAADIAAARSAMARKGPGLAMRYRGDRVCSRKHMAALTQAFGDVLDTETFEGRGHSLLTLDFHAPACQRLEGYFHARFRRPAQAV